MNMASTKRNWPVGRGFERYYGFLGGETNQWYPDLVYDNHPVDAARDARGGLPPHDRPHRQGDRVHPGRQGDRARQAVLHVLLPRRHARAAPRPEGVGRQVPGQVRHGLRGVPRARVRAPEGDGHHARPTPSCRRSTRTPRRRATTASRGPRSTWCARGTRSPTTRSGCSPAWPRSTPGSSATPTTRSGGCSTTSRRPASSTTRSSCSSPTTARSGEGGPNGSVNENKFFNGVPDDIEENLKYLDELGSPDDLQPLPDRLGVGVQHAVQDVEALQLRGRLADPLIVSWPKGIDAPGARSATSTCHAIDIVPTMYECLGVELPDVGQGLHPEAAGGRELPRPPSTSADVPTPKETGFYSMLGTRAIWHKGWKAVTVHPRSAGWGDFDQRPLGAVRHRDGPHRDATTSPTSTRRSCRS